MITDGRFMERMQMAFLLVILMVFYFSVHLSIYKLLVPLTGILNAYLLDQLLFLFIFLLLLLICIVKKRIILDKLFFLIFLGFFIFVIVALNDILGRYFISDDLLVLFSHLVNSDGLDYSYKSRYDFFYYQFLPFSLMFRFFRFNALFYNLFSLMAMALGASIFLKLLIWLNEIYRFKYKTLALSISVSFLLSPSILEGFFYIAYSTGIGYVVTITLLSLLFYLQFLHNKSKIHYFLLSYVLMLVILKTATSRVGFWPVVLCAFEFLYWPKLLKDRVSSIIRIFFLLVPFYSMTEAFTVGTNQIYGISPSRFINPERIYLFFANIIPALVPYYIWAPVVRWLRSLDTIHQPLLAFIANNIFLSSGIVFFVVVSAIIGIFYIRRYQVQLPLIFWLCSLASFMFYAFFGYGTQTLNSKSFDYSLLAYPSLTGSRYYILPLVFMLATTYSLLLTILKPLQDKIRKSIYRAVLLATILIVVSSLLFTKKVNYSFTKAIEPKRIASEKVLQLVPNDMQIKALFATNGDVGQGFEYFYPWIPQPTLSYFSDEQLLVQFLKKNKISRTNLYAFYFDNQSLFFEDKSQQLREKYKIFLDQ